MGFPLGGLDMVAKEPMVDETCVDYRGEVLLIVELVTSKDPV